MDKIRLLLSKDLSMLSPEALMPAAFISRMYPKSSDNIEVNMQVIMNVDTLKKEHILFDKSKSNYKMLIIVSLVLLSGAVFLMFLQVHLLAAVVFLLIPLVIFIFGENKETLIDSADRVVVITYSSFKNRKKKMITRTFSDLDFVYLYKFTDNRSAALGGDGSASHKIVNYCESLITKGEEEIILNIYSPERWGVDSKGLKAQALARSVQLNISIQDLTKEEKTEASGQMRNFGFLDEEKKSWHEKVEGVMMERKSLSSYKLL